MDFAGLRASCREMEQARPWPGPRTGDSRTPAAPAVEGAAGWRAESGRVESTITCVRGPRRCQVAPGSGRGVARRVPLSPPCSSGSSRLLGHEGLRQGGAIKGVKSSKRSLVVALTSSHRALGPVRPGWRQVDRIQAISMRLSASGWWWMSSVCMCSIRAGRTARPQCGTVWHTPH